MNKKNIARMLAEIEFAYWGPSGKPKEIGQIGPMGLISRLRKRFSRRKGTGMPDESEGTEARLRRRIASRDEQIELLRERVHREATEAAQCRWALQEQKNLQSLTEMGALRLKQSVEQLRGEVTSLRNRSNHFREAYEVKIAEVGALSAEVMVLQDQVRDLIGGKAHVTAEGSHWIRCSTGGCVEIETAPFSPKIAQ